MQNFAPLVGQGQVRDIVAEITSLEEAENKAAKEAENKEIIDLIRKNR